MNYYRVKACVTSRESHIKIDLATVSEEICSQAIVGGISTAGSPNAALETLSHTTSSTGFPVFGQLNGTFTP